MVEKPAILTSSVSDISNNENARARAARTGDGSLPMNRAKRAETTTHNRTVGPPSFTSLPIDRRPLPLAQSPAARRRRANQAKPTTEPPISKPPALPRVLHHPHRRAQRARAPAGTWSTALRWLLFHHRELGSMSLYYHLFCRRDHRVLLVIIIAIIAGSDRGSGVSGAKGRADKHTRFSRVCPKSGFKFCVK